MLPFALFAQGGQGDNWYFGIKAGISFNTASGAPEAVYDGQMETYQNPTLASSPKPIILLTLCMKTTNSNLSSLPKAAL